MSEPHKVTDPELVDRIREIVRHCDLRTTTASAVRRRLEEDLAVDLYGRRAFITQQIDTFLRNDDQEEAEEVSGNGGNGVVVEGGGREEGENQNAGNEDEIGVGQRSNNSHLENNKLSAELSPQMFNSNLTLNIHMAGHAGGPGPVDDRTHIWVEDDIFMPDHNKVVRYITSRFALQTCDEGHSWKYVTDDQQTWYWDEFVKKYRWDEKLNETARQLWYRNVATLYRRTIHSWRTTGRYPETVSETRWAAWIAAWHDQGWLDRTEKNKKNRSSGSAGPGTGTSKHIAGSKTYSAHYHSMRALQGTDPTSWDLYLHTHRRPDGSFVDERSRLVNQSMETYRDESLAPLDDGTIPDHPSSDEVNSMFKTVVGGRKKGWMYGCGSMASTIYPDDMDPRLRGSASRSSQDSRYFREEVESLRMDLQESQKRGDELAKKNEVLEKKNEVLESRMSSLEDMVRSLVSGLPQGPPVQPQTHSSHRDRVLYGRGSSSRGRSTVDPRRSNPYAASSSRGDPFGGGSSHHHILSQQ